MDGKMRIIGNTHQILQIEQAAILVLQLFQANWIDVMDVDPRKNRTIWVGKITSIIS